MQSSNTLKDVNISSPLSALTKEYFTLRNLCSALFEKGANITPYLEKMKALIDKLDQLPNQSMTFIVQKIHLLQDLCECPFFVESGVDTSAYQTAIQQLKDQLQTFKPLSLISFIKEINAMQLMYLAACNNTEQNKYAELYLANIATMTNLLKKHVIHLQTVTHAEMKEISQFGQTSCDVAQDFVGKKAYDRVVIYLKDRLAILQNLLLLVEKDPALSKNYKQLILHHLSGYKVLVADMYISLFKQSKDKTYSDEADKYAKDVLNILAEMKKPTDKRSKEILRAAENSTGTLIYPILAKLATHKNNIPHGKKYISLGKMIAEQASESSKGAAFCNLSEACINISDYYEQLANYWQAKIWIEYSLDLLEEVRLYLQSSHSSTLEDNLKKEVTASIEKHIEAASAKLIYIKTILVWETERKIKLLFLLDDRFITLGRANANKDFHLSLSFTNLRYMQELKKIFKHRKIDFDVLDEMSINIDLSNHEGALLIQALSEWLTRCKKLEERQCVSATPCQVPVGTSSPSPENSTSSIGKDLSYKEQKYLRHAAKEQLRKEAEDQESNSRPSTSGSSGSNEVGTSEPAASSKYIKWDNAPNLSQNPDDYFRAYGRGQSAGRKDRMVTFTMFSDDIFDSVPKPIAQKFQTVIPRGNVVASDKTQSSQGICFDLTAKERGKHNPPYVCKGKILGTQGAGDYRAFGFVRAKGTLFSPKPGQDKPKQKPCEVIMFDWVNPNSHNRC